MKIWSKQLLIKPDNSPYLMASPRARLFASASSPLYWTNIPQVAADDISTHAVGQRPFSFSFFINGDAIGAGTRFLADLPGIVCTKSENNTLAFWFYWEEQPVWRFIPAPVLTPGFNLVALSSNGVRLTITVNGSSAVLLDSEAGNEYPDLTAGTLAVYQSWEHLKNIQAVFL